MNSIGESCNELKQQYDVCFQTWFSDKFLKGDMNDSMCAPLFKVYQSCLKVLLFLLIIIMESCSQLKKHYDECFNTWFSEKFLKGDTDDSSCSSLLQTYKECKAIKDNKIEIKDIEVNHLGTDNEKLPPS
ncbi:Similar to TRIAP1: TP53-regulated inhibitor of apoptosis 1 (Homo sapiens) [Cotesia congregata]|uniref:Similar to TRIAP1: TP53-regulated inhibitor of apoptosis 1 (Homo sapiens) n=1 Tax=Cotesia congregata TaxID=51543 RepID=A0A8J2MEL8_COTCN|nr:Similar to TRIAP1: TP53-regulated inhibitor of apoptosis 1 (Homo sapiens) [Cotesia congregata]